MEDENMKYGLTDAAGHAQSSLNAADKAETTPGNEASDTEINDEFIEAYFSLADEDTPDLWGRIEAGLDSRDRRSTDTQKSSETLQNAAADIRRVDNVVHDANSICGRNGYNSRQHIVKIFAGVAAAVIVCALVLMGLVRSGLLTDRSSAGMDNSASNESSAHMSDDYELDSESSLEEETAAATKEAAYEEKMTESASNMTNDIDIDSGQDENARTDSAEVDGTDIDSMATDSADFDNTATDSADIDSMATDRSATDSTAIDSAEVVRIKITLADWEIGTGDEESVVYRCVVEEIEDNSFGIEAGQSIEVICGDTDAANDAGQRGEALDGYLTGYNSGLGAWTFTDK